MNIGTIKDIPIRLHYSFLALAFMFILHGYFSGGLAVAASTAMLIVVLFSCVLIHELGHALMAKKFLMDTRSIVLYPFGGIASINMKNMDSKSELYVAIAGPLTNLLLMLLSIPLVYMEIPFSFEFCAVNFIMGVFNMIPAFPMDGGRVLRAVLSLSMDRRRATLIAIRVSKVFTGLFILSGVLFGIISLLLVGMVLIYMISVESKRLKTN